MEPLVGHFRNIQLKSTAKKKEKRQQVLELNEENAVNSPGSDGKYLKFVVISDTHEKMEKIMEKIPDGDVLIHCGDFTNWGGAGPLKRFNNLLGLLPHKHKIVIPGNHEFGFDEREEYKKTRLDVCSFKGNLLTNCTLLIDESIELEGIKLYGSSYHLLYGFPFYCEEGVEMIEKWAKIPQDVDVLITHEPPKGYMDQGSRGQIYGDVDLLNAVEERNPKFHLFGHIHECYGAMTNGRTIFINAAQCDRQHQLNRLPIVFYMKVPE